MERAVFHNVPAGEHILRAAEQAFTDGKELLLFNDRIYAVVRWAISGDLDAFDTGLRRMHIDDLGEV